VVRQQLERELVVRQLLVRQLVVRQQLERQLVVGEQLVIFDLGMKDRDRLRVVPTTMEGQRCSR
jgi:hypothetical protein